MPHILFPNTLNEQYHNVKYIVTRCPGCMTFCFIKGVAVDSHYRYDNAASAEIDYI